MENRDPISDGLEGDSQVFTQSGDGEGASDALGQQVCEHFQHGKLANRHRISDILPNEKLHPFRGPHREETALASRERFGKSVERAEREEGHPEIPAHQAIPALAVEIEPAASRYNEREIGCISVENTLEIALPLSVLVDLIKHHQERTIRIAIMLGEGLLTREVIPVEI